MSRVTSIDYNEIILERLRDEIAMHSCRRLVENVKLFKNIPQDVLKSIVKKLKFELYLQKDVIIRAGTPGDCMYFLSYGTVAILTATGQEVKTSVILFNGHPVKTKFRYAICMMALISEK